MDLSAYQISAADWRAQIRRNQQRTKVVIVLFILIYLLVGFLVDTFILMSSYPQLSMEAALSALVSFQVIPWASLIMLGLAALALFLTFSAYDRLMLLGTDYREIKLETAKTFEEKQLYHVVEEMKIAAGLSYMPKVYLINADYMNAFASGYSEKSAMVAITKGLLEKLDRAEIQAVMSHELSHIRHQDIKLTLTVAILSNILLIALDLLFQAALYRGDRRNQDNRFLLVIMALRYILPLITIILTLFLSRTREYMADAGAVELMRDNQPMGRALLKIAQDHAEHYQSYEEQYSKTPHEQVRQMAYLFDPKSFNEIPALTSLFSTHPTIENRLKRIGLALKTKTK